MTRYLYVVIPHFRFKYESDHDIANMEANFREVMKEEARR